MYKGKEVVKNGYKVSIMSMWVDVWSIIEAGTLEGE